MFDINSAVSSYNAADLVAIIVLGVIGGAFGSFYNYLVDKVLRTYSIINEYVLTPHNLPRKGQYCQLV